MQRKMRTGGWETTNHLEKLHLSNKGPGLRESYGEIREKRMWEEKRQCTWQNFLPFFIKVQEGWRENLEELMN